MSFMHIYKTRTGYELVVSRSQDISQSISIINTFTFETKTLAKQAAREIKRTHYYDGYLVTLDELVAHNF